MRSKSLGMISGCRGAFSLLEALMMLVALVVFTLLLAGVTKPLWHDTQAPQDQSKESSKAQPTTSSR
jgi:hypothetical protein